MLFFVFSLNEQVLYLKDRVIAKVRTDYFPLFEVKNVDYVNGALTRFYKLPHSINSILQNLNIRSVEGLILGKITPEAMELGLHRIIVIYFNNEIDVERVIRNLQSTGMFEYVEPWYIYKVDLTPNDPLVPNQWHLYKIQAFNAWDITNANGIVVAAVDNAVVWDHPDLGGIIWNNLGEDANGNGYTIFFNGSTWQFDPGDLDNVDNDGNGFKDDLIGWDFYSNDNNPRPEPCDPNFDDHGTHTTGIMAAWTNNNVGVAGEAWGAKAMAIRTGNCGYIYYSINGTYYAANNGAKIINHSYGSSNYSGSQYNSLSYARSLGANNYASAGNDGANAIRYPCGYNDVVVCVAATDQNDIKANFSNYGTWVDVSAPGVNVLSTAWNSSNNSYTYAAYSGTSMSSPSAAGVAALIKAANPNLSVDEVDTVLLCSADNIDALNPNYAGLIGSGRVNAYKAVRMAKFAGVNVLKIRVDDSNYNNNKRAEVGEQVKLYLTLTNPRCYRNANNVQLQLINDDPNITVIDGNINAGNITMGQVIEPADFFEVSISGNQPRFWNFKVKVISSPQNADTILNLRLTIGFPEILLVDADTLTSFENYYMQALDSLGKVYDIVKFSDKDAFYSSARSIIIWHTGNRSSNVLTNEERDTLINWLNSGKKLFISSQYLAEDQNGSQFITNYLGASVVQTGISYKTMVAETNDPLGNNLKFRLFNPDGAQNANSNDNISPQVGARRAFKWTNVLGSGDYGGAMVYRIENGMCKTVFLAGPFEAISNTQSGWNKREELMSAILNCFVNVSADEIGIIPFGIYPSLKNSKIIIKYHLKDAQNISISVYSIDGSKIHQITIKDAKYGIYKVPVKSKGIYILKVNDKVYKLINN
jgi:subtilisin family serine protease